MQGKRGMHPVRTVPFLCRTPPSSCGHQAQPRRKGPFPGMPFSTAPQPRRSRVLRWAKTNSHTNANMLLLH